MANGYGFPRRIGGETRVSALWSVAAADPASWPAFVGLPAGWLIGHPLTRPFGLPVSPLASAIGGAALVTMVAFVVPKRPAPPARSGRPVASWEGSLGRSRAVTRALVVVMLLLAVAAGRLGVDDELENLAPALVVGVAWPLLVLATVVLGPIWRWLDPWDGIARVTARGEMPDEHGSRSVWPAVFVVLPWVWYLSAYPDPLAPGSVGAILAVYSIFTIAGCLAFGRERWLSSAEPLGIVLSWMALLPRGRLGSWRPPQGAEALLGVLAGGVLFGAARRSELWGSLNAVPGSAVLATLAVAVSSAAAATVLLVFARQAARLGAAGSVARAAVPAVAGIIVAVAMDRDRLTTSLQILPALVGDPFGRGWDLLGRAGEGLNAAPLGTAGLLLAQLALLLLGHGTGAFVLARGERRRDRDPAAGALAVLTIASAIVLLTH